MTEADKELANQAWQQNPGWFDGYVNIQMLINLVRADEREECAMNVWIVNQLAQQPDADDRGVIGWLQEAEDQIRAWGNK